MLQSHNESYWPCHLISLTFLLLYIEVVSHEMGVSYDASALPHLSEISPPTLFSLRVCAWMIKALRLMWMVSADKEGWKHWPIMLHCFRAFGISVMKQQLS